ncbi:MAG: N-acetylmuramoyl-L-alanine amidase [Armatimonadia bacterium]
MKHLIAVAVLLLAVAPLHPALGGPLSGEVICVDPGHPSETSSGTSGKKITELRANWLVALKLKAVLQSMGATVVLTKARETQVVTNRRRAETANAARASLMIRLHCDCACASGLAVYYPDRRGRCSGRSGPSPLVISRSRAAGVAFYASVTSALKGKVRPRGLHGDSATLIGSKQGALTASIFSKVPVLTIEMVTLTQRADEDFIAGPTGQLTMAKAIATALIAAAKALK